MTTPDPTNKDLEGRIGGVEEKVEELATAVVGPEKGGLSGNGRVEEEGLIAKVDLLIKTLSNGGLKIKLPVPVWVAIIGGAVAIIVQLIIAWVDRQESAALGALAVQLIATLGS